MVRLEYPQYQKAVDAYIKGQSTFFHKARRSIELSRKEKLLLDVRAKFRIADWHAALELLERFPSSEGIDFLSAECDFLMATAYFQMGQMEMASVYNLKSLDKYRQLNDRRGSFLSSYNLSSNYSRQGCLKLAEYYLSLALGLAETPSEKVLILRAQACECSKQSRFQEAIALLKRAMELRQDLSEGDFINLKTVAADIYFRAGMVDMAEELLNDVRLVQSNLEHIRAEFDWRLLNVLKSGQRLGVQPELLSSSDEYLLKWKIAKALEGGERKEAMIHWKSLMDLFPQTYKDHFETLRESDAKTIFMKYVAEMTKPKDLDRHVQRCQVKQGSLLEKLFAVLKSANGPLRKEEIIEHLWETAYLPEYDARFYKLVERLKSQTGLKIVVANRAYRLEYKSNA